MTEVANEEFLIENNVDEEYLTRFTITLFIIR